MHGPRTISVFLTAVAAPLVVAWAGCASAPTEDGALAEVLSFHDDGLFGNGLTRAEVQTVLALIDGVCGDTWCEGDNDFRFRYLFCETGARTCTLQLQMGARQETPNPARWRWYACRTTEFLGFDSLVSTASSGYQSLTNKYYDALSTCIGGLDKGSPGP